MRSFGFQSAFLELTNRCNLNCITCYNQSGCPHPIEDMPLEQVTTAIETLRRHNAVAVSFAGGEPLLYPWLDQLLALLDRYSDMQFSFVTNGTIAPSHFVECYRSMENLTVQISLDGSCEEVNARTRGSGNFDRSMRLLRQLSLPSKKARVKMVISTVNLEDVESFFRMVVENGAIPEFAFVDCIGNAARSLLIPSSEKIRLSQLVDRLIEELQVPTKRLLATYRCSLAEDYEDMLPLIKVNGTIIPCQLLYDDAYSLGNIHHFEPEAFIKRCEEISSLVFKRRECDYGCSRCFIRSTCKHGCMAHAIDLTGDPLGDDGNCAFRRSLFLHLPTLPLKEEVNA